MYVCTRMDMFMQIYELACECMQNSKECVYLDSVHIQIATKILLNGELYHFVKIRVFTEQFNHPVIFG